MKKAIIYKPSKTSMQSGRAKTKKWLLKFKDIKSGINPLMGWESSTNTLSEINLEFSSKDEAVNYAKKNNIIYELIESKDRKIIKKSYADNFIK
jgi:hypothetical protein